MSDDVSAETPNPKSETGWLIERRSRLGGTMLWYAAGPASRWERHQAVETPEIWTDDASKAIRFARKADADTLIHFEGFRNAVAVEHAWQE
jgi:hypothetical protein